MARRPAEPDDESGIQLRDGDYPLIKRKPPPAADPEPARHRAPPSWKDRMERVPWKKVAKYGAAGLVGFLLGYLISPSGSDAGDVKKAVAVQDQKVKSLQYELTTARTALATEQEASA